MSNWNLRKSWATLPLEIPRTSDSTVTSFVMISVDGMGQMFLVMVGISPLSQKFKAGFMATPLQKSFDHRRASANSDRTR
ncbi:MAG: hypothetical protein ACREJM_00720 [Candidatus Saccharimonadales bacterium]